MKILRTYFGEIVISLFINVGLIYSLLYIIRYHWLFGFPLILLAPFLHIFLFLFLIKKILKKKRLSNIILYLTTNSIYFLYSYLSYRFIHESIYLYTPFLVNHPTDDQFLVNAFNGIYFQSKVTFILFVISFLFLSLFILIRKYKKEKHHPLTY